MNQSKNAFYALMTQSSCKLMVMIHLLIACNSGNCYIIIQTENH